RRLSCTTAPEQNERFSGAYGKRNTVDQLSFLLRQFVTQVADNQHRVHCLDNVYCPRESFSLGPRAGECRPDRRRPIPRLDGVPVAAAVLARECGRGWLQRREDAARAAARAGVLA